MEHFIELPVTLNNEALSFPCRLVTFGYSYKFYIVVDKQEIVFERDDEMNFRAVNLNPQVGHTIKNDLLEAMTGSLKKLLE